MWFPAPDAETHRALGNWLFYSNITGAYKGVALVAAIGQLAQGSNIVAACIAWLP